LNAIREITEEKQMYDAREKASLDIQSNLIDARQEGREEGREEGRQEGIEIGEQRGEQRGDQRGKLKASIQIYEGLLGDSVTSESILSSRSTEELESMVANLQKRLRDRSS
jgi:flagellar biosynthesis/type III secretory pathway protein FliH